MRRVLIIDAPWLESQFDRLSMAIGRHWNVVITSVDQVPFWESFLGPEGQVGSATDADSLIEVGESVELCVAACSAELLNVASNLAFRPQSTTIVVPSAYQTSDWIFSLYPLSEGPVPRVWGVFEDRQSPAVQGFEASLPPQLKDRHLVCARKIQIKPTPDYCEDAFVQDIGVLRRLAGEFKTLMAVAIADDDGSYRNLTVTLGGDDCGTVTWTIQEGPESAWELRQGHGEGPVLSRARHEGYWLTPESGTGEPSQTPPFVPWKDVLRAFDDIAALRRSLKKRRQVELQTEIISEQAQFKSVMSASGCGLLIATLFGAVALLAAGAAFDPRQSQQRTSEKAGLVLREVDFRSGATELTQEASAEWPGMVRRLGQTAAPILIEQTSESSIDQQRRERLVSILAEQGVPSPGSRVEVYEFRGKVFLNLLTMLWALLFLPLGIFLAVQVLLLAMPSGKAK